MYKYIVSAVLGVAIICSIIALSIKVFEQKAEIELKDKEIAQLKINEEQLIKSYEQDIEERELNNKNRKKVVKEIVKVVGDEKCINSTIDAAIIERLQRQYKPKP